MPKLYSLFLVSFIARDTITTPPAFMNKDWKGIISRQEGLILTWWTKSRGRQKNLDDTISLMTKTVLVKLKEISRGRIISKNTRYHMTASVSEGMTIEDCSWITLLLLFSVELTKYPCVKNQDIVHYCAARVFYTALNSIERWTKRMYWTCRILYQCKNSLSCKGTKKKTAHYKPHLKFCNLADTNPDLETKIQLLTIPVYFLKCQASAKNINYSL
jgi:hypothetical protein